MMTGRCANARNQYAQTWLFCLPAWLLGCVIAVGAEVSLPRATEKAVVHLPDICETVRSFDAPAKRPVAWWPHVVNAAWGGASERSGTWLDRNWELVDYVDRSANASCHDYLKHRGIWYEVYGSNEYQESIHFHEEGVRKPLWNNGIAQDMNGRRVVSEGFNLKVAWWAKEVGWDTFITCNNAPRWSAIIDYDWLTSPLLGFAISQDNIGGPTSRIGAGGHGRYCDYCSAKFFDHLRAVHWGFSDNAELAMKTTVRVHSRLSKPGVRPGGSQKSCPGRSYCRCVPRSATRQGS
jgi:hypothetical protein